MACSAARHPHPRFGLSENGPRRIRIEAAMKTVEQLRELPVEDRLQIVGELWDSIAEDSSAIKLTPAQLAELDRRLDDLEKNPSEGRPWEEVRADIENRL